MKNPSGSIKMSLLPVTAQSLATLPVFGGICGSTNTMCNGRFNGGSLGWALIYAPSGVDYHRRGGACRTSRAGGNFLAASEGPARAISPLRRGGPAPHALPLDPHLLHALSDRRALSRRARNGAARLERARSLAHP